MDRLTCRTEIVLEPDARVLHLDTADAIRDFHREYSERIRPPLVGEDAEIMSRFVRWRDVADRWQGIVIAPYQWELRMAMGYLWYYGWDCASGCIWDASAIREQAAPI